MTVNMSVISREPDTTYGELLKAMWEAVGIKTELKATERLEWINNMKKDNFEIGFWQGSTFLGGFVRDRIYHQIPGQLVQPLQPRRRPAARRGCQNARPRPNGTS